MKKLNHEKSRINYETGEIEEVNDNFVQLYLDNLDLIVKMTSENPSSVKVFIWLLKHMDKRNALVVSQQALAEATKMSRTTVYRATEYLKKEKALKVFKSGNTNIYAVNAQIAWKSTADNKKYAWFDAKVYISSLEQLDENEALFDTQLVGMATKKIRKNSLQKRKNEDVGSFESQEKIQTKKV
jgi:hypothetical protein